MNIKLRTVFLLIFAVFLLRLLSLGFYDLYDTTEARYAGIGMRMTISKNYITPMIEPSIPFLAKPPLSFWATALSLKIFGFNEFGARFPHFVISVILTVMVFFIFKFFYDTRFATIFTLIFSSTVGFIVIAGMVTTEAFLIFSTTLSLITFWILLEKNASNKWNYLFFVSFALSMLIKGPVGIVLTALPMVIYLTIYRKWLEFFRKFWVFRGIVLFLLISLPWYIIAEIKNPGFFEYFFVGEHIKRFLVPSWSGDLYGHAHKEPIGMIWIFSFALMLPWVLYPIYYLCHWLIYIKSKKFTISKESSYFLICAIVPLLFFTFARNIIPSYAMFVFFPLSFLITKLVIYRNTKQFFLIIASLFTFFLVLMALILCVTGYFAKHSDKSLIQVAIKNGANVVYYVGDAPYSARFYSQDSINIIRFNHIASLPLESFVVIDDLPDSYLNLQNITCQKNSNRCLYKTI